MKPMFSPASLSPADSDRCGARLICLVTIWAALTTAFVTLIGVLSPRPVFRAVIIMALGLAVFWILLGGLTQRRFRDGVRDHVVAAPGDWRLKFVLFCTLMACLEEAITTGMTNLAPALGVPYGSAYITASGNYLDVICGHSVVVFVPMFCAWAWMLSRWDFHSNHVLLLFGVTGTLAELSFGGPSALANLGFWSLVYGLMIYLPAYSLPARPQVTVPKLRHYVMAALFPIVWAIPVALIVSRLHPYRIHFPPLQG